MRDAVASGIRVVPVPGACASTAALSASGLPTDTFLFEGFLPSKAGKRRERLAALKGEPRLLVFHEAPTRVAAALADILEILGDREMVLARELTKVYEEFLRGRVSEVLRTVEELGVKGEIVLLIAPSPEERASNQDLVPELLSRYLDGEGMFVKDAVKRVTQETGEARSRVYREALKLRK